MDSIIANKNRLDKLSEEKRQRVLNIYFTAGFPHLEDTKSIIETLQEAGADVIEIGVPYSDPVADGPTIQGSNQVALQNGISIKKLFEQLTDIRKTVSIPLVMMGYINPMLQYGIERFCKKCKEIGIDGLIIPDMPLWEYETFYKKYFEENGLYNIFLVTPQTSDDRIRAFDEMSKGFIYAVSSASITGARTTINLEQEKYFKRLKSLNLKNPFFIGFGISDSFTFNKACEYANGAFIGSAFVTVLQKEGDLRRNIIDYIKEVKQ